MNALLNLNLQFPRCYVGNIFVLFKYKKHVNNHQNFIFDIYTIGLPHILLCWCFKLCSSMKHFNTEVEQLRRIFKCNYYLVNIIDQCIRNVLDKLYIPKQTVTTVHKKDLLIALPFLGKYSVNFRTCLYKSVSKTLSYCNVKVVFQSKNRLSNFFKLKNSISFSILHFFIYTYVQCSTVIGLISAVIAILLTMAKLNVILKLELVSIEVSLHSQEKGSISKNLLLKITAFCQVMCIPLVILPPLIMSHSSKNV